MPLKLIYQALELLDHVTQLMPLLDQNNRRRKRGDD